MDTNRVLKFSVWIYIAALVALTLAHVNWQAEIGNPFNIYHIVALCIAGCLARLAYPDSPSFAFLMMIATVSALGLAHVLTIGNDGRPFDIIVNMASGMWGVALGAVIDRTRLPSVFRRNATD
ncbi:MULTISPECIES: hypothetical protein [Rhizobium]|uniref:VanZ family protein n=1 Tax=Rhizobium rhododendri TaxID=2506430 RepID=A0ABY8IIF9_9HYPH|nr:MULTISPECIES: hypothetical protein [Rhizobium]WFS23457.1 hypothetical protein PR018_02720 [Rhizobium rhododendri]